MKMHDMGYKEDYPKSCPCEMNESEIRRPEIYLSGVHAERMGVTEMEVDKDYTITMKVRLKSKTVSEGSEGRKKEVSGTLCVLEASDWEAEDDEAEQDGITKIVTEVVRRMQ